MRSPRLATNSKCPTYDFLIASEFHLHNAPNWLSPSLLTPGALARPSQSLATSHSSPPLSNRHSKLLESPVTRTKQTATCNSNRYKTPLSPIFRYNGGEPNRKETAMPIYEYVCDECKARYERIVTVKNAAPACPKCGSARSTIQFSTFAAHTGNGGTSSSSASTESASASGGCACTPHSCGCH